MMRKFYALVLLLTTLCFGQRLQAQEAYAVLMGDGETVTFYYDKQKTSRGGIEVASWKKQNWPIVIVVFDASFVNYKPKSLSGFFNGCDKLVNIKNIEYLNTSDVTSMYRMFFHCSSLMALDLTSFNTEKVTSMYEMFSECLNLTSLNVSGFNTNNVTTMHGMFWNCSNLTSLNVGGFNTEKVIDMSCMFYGCSGLTTLDVSGFNTENVTDMGSMFQDCSGLTTLDVSGFKTENVTSIGGMFNGCSSLTTLDVSGFKTDNVTGTGMRRLFKGCSNLKSLDVSGFKTDNVTNMESLFDGCSSLTSLDVSGFKTDKVTSMFWMFNGCSCLTSLDVSGLNTENVTYMRGMFSGCSSLTSLDVSGFITDNVTSMSTMFQSCSSLTSIDVSGFNTENLIDMSNMFCGCTGLKTLNLRGINTENVTSMFNMFTHCSSLEDLDLNCFNTKKVENMERMFYNCSSMKKIYVSEDKWSTACVISGEMMFEDCFKLVGGQGTSYSAEHINHAYAHIDGGVTNPGYLTDIKAKTENKELKVNDIFTFDGITYKVTSTSPKEVQVGTGVNEEPAIDKETSGKVSVPSSVTGSDGNSYSVTAIGISAFQRCYGITSIDIPQTIVSIGNYAFWGLDIKSFAIPKGTIAIGDMAFWGCRYLESISIPESVHSIGYQAFYSCRMLTSIVIPKSTNSIGTGVFNACWKLGSIVVEEGNPVYDSRDNSNSIIETQTNTLIAGCSKTTIPNTVKQIAPKAFAQTIAEDNHVYELIIPKSVEVIGEEAFWNNNGLLSVDIPSSVNSIGSKAFADCGHLEKVSVYHNQPLAITDVFQGCTYGLLYLYVPAGTKALYEATEGWKEFKNIVEMDVVEDNLTYNFGEEGNLTVTGTVDGQETTIEIPAKIVIDGREYIVTIIAADAFKDNTNLQSVTIPETVEKIGVNAFSGCSSLSAVTLPKNVNSIGDGAFTGCTEMKLVKVECSPVEVGTDIFVNCDKLEEAVYDCKVITPLLRKTKIERVKIEKSVTDIDKEAFLECKNLAAIDFPESVERIGESAFNGCTGIKAIELPKSVSKIEESAFGKCTDMLTLKIGEGIKEIQSAAFSDCVKLTDVFVYAKELPVTSSEAFKDTDVKQITLHVPEEAMKDYERTVPWIDFKIIKAIVPEAISIVMDSNKPVDVYSTAGVLVKQGVMTLKDLKKGVYIIGTRKLLVK